MVAVWVLLPVYQLNVRQRTYTYLSAPSWAPDGTRVAFGVNNSKYVGIRIQDIEGRAHKRDPDATSTGPSTELVERWNSAGLCLVRR